MKKQLFTHRISGFEYDIHWGNPHMDVKSKATHSSFTKELIEMGIPALEHIGNHFKKGISQKPRYKNSEKNLQYAWSVFLDIFHREHKMSGESPIHLETWQEKVEWCFKNSK